MVLSKEFKNNALPDAIDELRLRNGHCDIQDGCRYPALRKKITLKGLSSEMELNFFLQK
jgi:hypothetical protein